MFTHLAEVWTCSGKLFHFSSCCQSHSVVRYAKVCLTPMGVAVEIRVDRQPHLAVSVETGVLAPSLQRGPRSMGRLHTYHLSETVSSLRE